MSGSIFTIGHSNRTITEFLALLHHSGITLLVDVRSLPGSTRHPQFNEAPLADSLAATGIESRRAGELTGRRPVSNDVPFQVNAWWQNRSFHNYADHALSAGFGADLAELREWARQHRIAVMCAEAVWWRCHRRIIADHLLAHRDEVFHILGRDRVEIARLSPGAVVTDDLGVTYPAVA